MEGRLDSLSKISDAWFNKTPSNMPVDPGEAVVAQSLRAIGRLKLNRYALTLIMNIFECIATKLHICSARIKIHRYSAFVDTPIFSKRHCDLEPTTPMSSPGSASTASHSNLSADCTCNDLLQKASEKFASISSGAPAPFLPSPPTESSLPYNSAYSARICCKAAMNIAETFDVLPYPNPSGVIDPAGFLVLPDTSLPPRTMPTFACCAMQSAYALLMLLYRVYAGQLDSRNDDIDIAVTTYVGSLRHNLSLILTALENYASAFEAIDGMRGMLLPLVFD